MFTPRENFRSPQSTLICGVNPSASVFVQTAPSLEAEEGCFDGRPWRFLNLHYFSIDKQQWMEAACTYYRANALINALVKTRTSFVAHPLVFSTKYIDLWREIFCECVCINTDSAFSGSRRGMCWWSALATLGRPLCWTPSRARRAKGKVSTPIQRSVRRGQ